MATYVFGVGGARCTVQAEAVLYLSRNAPYEWLPTRCLGNSGGALNAAMVATGQISEMVSVWRTISNSDVYKHKFSVARAVLAATSGNAMLNTQPLLDLLNKYLLGFKCIMPLTVQYITDKGVFTNVTVESGQEITAKHIQALYNSSVIPFAFPVKFGAYDGGLFNPLPLDAAIQQSDNGSKMVILSAHPLDDIEMDDSPKRSTGHLVRAVELLQRGLIRKDMQIFDLVNAVTKDNHVEGLKYFESMVIAPDATWWGMLDFDRAGSDILIKGYAQDLAKKALERVVS
jgi:predicted acylesterase/phospholipase RssA